MCVRGEARSSGEISEYGFDQGNASVHGLIDRNGEMAGIPGGGREETVRELVGDRALDLLLARAAQLRLTGEGSMLDEPVANVTSLPVMLPGSDLGLAGDHASDQGDGA
jgi:hypothetical protein